MRFFYILLIISILATHLVFAQTAEEYFKSGVQFNQAQNYPEAVWSFGQVIQKSPGNAQAYAWRGYSQNKLHYFTKATEDYNRALMLNANDAWTLGNRAVLRIRQGNYQEAVMDLEKAILLNPENPWNYVMRAEAKWQARKAHYPIKYAYFDIVNDYSLGIGLQTNYAFAYRRRAEALLDSLKISPRIPAISEMENICQDLNTAYNLGEKVAEKLIQEHCDKKIPYFLIEKASQIAQQNLQNQEYRKAYNLYDYIVQTGISDSPYFLQALENRAEMRTLIKDLDGAINDYTLLISLHREHEYLARFGYYRRALVYKQLNNPVAALNDIDKAIELNYDHSWVYFEKGNLKLILENPDEACENWKISQTMGNEKAGELIKQNCGKRR